MTVNVDKGPALDGSTAKKVEGEPEVHVVTYDEEQPPEAYAIPIDSSPDNIPLTQNKPPETFQTPSSTQQNSQVVGDDGFDCLLCGDTRLRRLGPGRHFSITLCGDIYLDLLDSQYAPGTKIMLLSIRLCGSVKMLVPPGTRVVVHRLLLCGNRDIHVDADPEQDPLQPAPQLTVTIFSLCGDVRVRSNRNDMSGGFFDRC